MNGEIDYMMLFMDYKNLLSNRWRIFIRLNIFELFLGIFGFNDVFFDIYMCKIKLIVIILIGIFC